VKVAIREDHGAGLVRAYFSRMDDSERVEVATVSLYLLKSTPELFGRWKDLLTFALKAHVEAAGFEVIGFTEIAPHEGN
jgi:hypothetical protein